MAAIDVIGRLVDRIMNKDNNRTFSRATDSLEAVSEAIASIGGVVASANALPFLYEDWGDLIPIDAVTWSVTNPATGVAWTPQVVILSPNPIWCVTEPNANETARLATHRVWNVPATVLVTHYVVKRLIVEFEFALTGVANVDNTLTIMGMTQTLASTRATNNLIGWGLLADALQSITDIGGVEETNTGFGETLTTPNKLRMDIIAGATPTVEFRLNETLVATHNTSIPLVPSYFNVFIDTEAGGAAGLYIGTVRIRYEDIVRSS